jgi:hypothetical protein
LLVVVVVPVRLIFPPPELILIVPDQSAIPTLLPCDILLLIDVPVRLIFPPSELMEVPVPCILMAELP